MLGSREGQDRLQGRAGQEAEQKALGWARSPGPRAATCSDRGLWGTQSSWRKDRVAARGAGQSEDTGKARCPCRTLLHPAEIHPHVMARPCQGACLPSRHPASHLGAPEGEAWAHLQDATGLSPGTWPPGTLGSCLESSPDASPNTHKNAQKKCPQHLVIRTPPGSFACDPRHGLWPSDCGAKQPTCWRASLRATRRGVPYWRFVDS